MFWLFGQLVGVCLAVIGIGATVSVAKGVVTAPASIINALADAEPSDIEKKKISEIEEAIFSYVRDGVTKKNKKIITNYFYLFNINNSFMFFI